MKNAREVIYRHLQALKAELGEFEQTTHSILGNGSIEMVANALVRVYKSPDSYGISSLSQVIGQLKEEPDAPR